MSPLHSLRLNCLLAPLATAAVGLLALAIAWWLHSTALHAAALRAHLAEVDSLAQLAEADAAPPLPSWLASHPGWRGVARVQVQDEELVVLAQAGAVPLTREVTPDLLLAFQAARAWRDGALAACAAPCLPRGGPSSVLVAWRAPPPAPPLWPWLALGGGVLLIGGGLGIYLVLRVYRPVEWLQQAADAAAAGRPEPGGAPDSPETASLRSSIATLIAKRRHTDGGDA